MKDRSKNKDPRIIFKDRHLLILDKPAGMPTTKGDIPNSLEDWLEENFPKAQLVNRLDNETSGIVVAAKKDSIFEKLREIWNKKEIVKEYTAIVLGQTPPNGKITKLIAHHPKNKKKMIVVETDIEAKELGAKYAETEFEILEYFLDYSLLKIRIITGVRHQIRIHLASIGHPIAGDKLYKRIKHESRDWLESKHHLLHASKISFTHPKSGKVVSFESELPKDLAKHIAILRG